MFLVSSNISAEEHLVQEIVVYKDTALYKYRYWYNSDNKKTLEQESCWKDGAWKNTSQVEWQYDNELCITQTFRKHEANAWKKQYQFTLSYNEANLLIKKLATNYAENQLGIKESKDSLVYNNEGKITKQLFYLLKKNRWELQYSNSYTYTNGQLETTLLKNAINNTEYKTSYTYIEQQPEQQTIEKKTGNFWTNLHQYKWSYDASGKLTYMVAKNWEKTNAGYQWVNTQNVSYEYKNNLLTQETYQYWNSEYWENEMLYTYDYLSDGTYAKRTLYLPLHNQWREVSSMRYNYESEPNRKIIESVYDFWGGNTGTGNNTQIPYILNTLENVESKVGNKLEIHYTRESDTGTNPNKNEASITIYPNPSKGIYYIDTQKYNIHSWKVITLNGALVKTHTNTDSTGVIDITNQEPGMYLLQVNSEQGTFIIKMIKQ